MTKTDDYRTSRRSVPTKFQSLQVCRGFAALLVLLFHVTIISKTYLDYDLLNGIFLFGYSGVDFFFVLSGFIICWSHRSELGHPRSCSPYLRKRFIRIYPLYWIVALALLPVYFGIPRSLSDCVVLIKSLLLLPQISNPIVIVAWSLTSEVFFYALFALAILFPWGRIRFVFAIWLLVTAVFYFGKLAGVGVLQVPPHAGFIFSPYNLEFAMGCLAAYLAANVRFRGEWLMAVGVLFFLGFAVSESYVNALVGRQHSILAYGVAALLIVLGAVQWERNSARVLPPFLLLLGNASYSIYLTHDAVLDLSVRAMRASGIIALTGSAPLALLSIVLALTTGVLFYLFVEKPLLARLRQRRSNVNPTMDRPSTTVETLSATSP